MKITIEFDDDKRCYGRNDIRNDLYALQRRLNEERRSSYNIRDSKRLSEKEFEKLLYDIKTKERYVAQLIYCIDKTNQHEELVNNLRYALGIVEDY